MNELENHKEKCRICLWQFDNEDVQIKITPVVEERFLIFTQIEVRNLICSFYLILNNFF